MHNFAIYSPCRNALLLIWFIESTIFSFCLTFSILLNRAPKLDASSHKRVLVSGVLILNPLTWLPPINILRIRPSTRLQSVKLPKQWKTWSHNRSEMILQIADEPKHSRWAFQNRRHHHLNLFPHFVQVIH